MTETSPRPRSEVVQAAGLLAVSLVGLLSLFGVYWGVLRWLGTGGESDALFAAIALPQLVLSITQAALSYVLIPILATSDADTRARDGWTFFQGALVLFGGMAFVLYLTSGVWVELIVPGFDARTLAITQSLVHIQLVTMVFTALRVVANAVYHAKGHFLRSEGSEAVGGVIALMFFFALLDELGVYAAAWSFALRYGVAVLLLLPGMGRYHRPRLRDEALLTSWRRAWPLLAGTAYTRLDMLLDRGLASLTAPGLLSLLNVAQQIYGAGNLLIHKAGSAPAFPRLAQLAKVGEWRAFRRLYRARLAANGGLALGGVTIVLVIGQPALALVFGGVTFTDESVAQLWWILLGLSGLLIAGSMGQVTAMSFYALGDTRTPMIVAVISFTLSIGLKLVGFWLAGVVGIAVTTSLYYFATFVAVERCLAARVARELEKGHRVPG